MLFLRRILFHMDRTEACDPRCNNNQEAFWSGQTAVVFMTLKPAENTYRVKNYLRSY